MTKNDKDAMIRKLLGVEMKRNFSRISIAIMVLAISFSVLVGVEGNTSATVRASVGWQTASYHIHRSITRHFLDMKIVIGVLESILWLQSNYWKFLEVPG